MIHCNLFLSYWQLPSLGDSKGNNSFNTMSIPTNVFELQEILSISFLTLKASITTAAADIHKYFYHCFSENFKYTVICF